MLGVFFAISSPFCSDLKNNFIINSAKFSTSGRMVEMNF